MDIKAEYRTVQNRIMVTGGKIMTFAVRQKGEVNRMDGLISRQVAIDVLRRAERRTE